MSIRRAPQYSDRGSIRDLVSDPMPAVKFTSAELRYKKLYEYAQINKDQKLISAMGIITTDSIGDKKALSLNTYRIRQDINNIKAKSPDKFVQLTSQFESFFNEPVSEAYLDYLNKARIIKSASVRKPPVFRRVSKP
jgi:hypothetical protein